MDEELLKNWEKRTVERGKIYKTYLNKINLKKAIPKLPQLHDLAFEKVDCLSCGNCCKGYSPRFKTPDIKRISKYVGLREGSFIDKYLKIDSDGDYVLQQTPCPFLGSDNYCSIYAERPSDCRRFPYTDEDVFVKRTAITLKNVSFCPAAYFVIEKLMESNP
jgi:Fe-S-cluster containining protein